MWYCLLILKSDLFSGFHDPVKLCISNHQKHACYIVIFFHLFFKSVECFWVKIRAIERNLMVSAVDLGEEEEVDQTFTFKRPQALVLKREFNLSRKTAQWCITIWNISRMYWEWLLHVAVDGATRNSALLDWMFTNKDLLEDKNVNSSCRDCKILEAKDLRRTSDQIKTWTSEKQISIQSGNF